MARYSKSAAKKRIPKAKLTKEQSEARMKAAREKRERKMAEPGGWAYGSGSGTRGTRKANLNQRLELLPKAQDNQPTDDDSSENSSDDAAETEKQIIKSAAGLPPRSSGEQIPQQEPRAGKKVQQKGHYWCATCAIDCLDQLSFNMHMGGRKHRERVCVETRVADTEEFAQAKSRLDAEMSDDPATSSTMGQQRPVGAPTWDLPVQHWSKDPKPVAAAASRIESSGGASTTISTLVCCILHGAEIGQSADAVQQNQNPLITKPKSVVILDALRAVQTNAKMSLEAGRTGLRPVVICSQRHCEGLLHLQEQRMLEQLPDGDGVDEEALVLRRALQEGAYIVTNHHFHRYRDIVNVKWIKARCIRYSALRTILYTLYNNVDPMMH
jgi:hypothetical protein